MSGLRTPAPALALRAAPPVAAGPDLTFELCDPSSAAAPDGWAECIREQSMHQLWDWSIVHLMNVVHRGVVAGLFRDGARVVGLGTARVHTLSRSFVAGGLADVTHLALGALPGIALGNGLPRTLHQGGPAPDLLEAAARALETALRREFGRRLQGVAYRQVYAGELPVFQRGTTLTREGKSVAALANRSPTTTTIWARSPAHDGRTSAGSPAFSTPTRRLTVRFVPTPTAGSTSTRSARSAPTWPAGTTTSGGRRCGSGRRRCSAWW